MLTHICQDEKVDPTFPPPGWCFTLSVEPILERALRMSGAGAVPGRAVVLEVVAVVEEATRGARGTSGFLSAAVPAVEDGVAGLGAVVRVREAAAVEAVLRTAAAAAVAVEVLGLVELAVKKERDCFV